MSETERRLARMWSELLGVENVRRTDHFAMLGGSSLNAAQLVNRVRERFGRELSLAEVMRSPTLEHIARAIDGPGAVSRPEPARLPTADDGAAAASEAQARMVFLDRAHPGSPLNNIPLTLSVSAAPDESRLQQAMNGLAERHVMLHARLLVEERGVVQRFDAPTPRLEVLQARDTAHARLLLERFHRREYGLDRGPLWRVVVARAADSGRAWLALSFHHAIADGVTLVRMLGELDALYQGRPLPPTDTELSYADYVGWQRELIESPFGEEAARFWSDDRRRRPLPRLPRAPGNRDDVGGRQFAVDLDARDTALLKSICAEQQVSPFVLMLGLFGFVLGQRCDARQLALGVTLSGRSRRTLETVPGLFVNTVPLAFDWSDRDHFGELLERVQSRLAELQDLQDYPLNRVMAAQKLRDLPFNILFNEEMLPAELSFGGASATLEAVSTGIARLPLLISFLFGGPTWRFRVECREHLPAWTAELLQDFQRLLKALDGMTGARLGELQNPDEQVMSLLGAN
jgi:arthrofactin-type cyclic lipopeptide synthetase C